MGRGGRGFTYNSTAGAGNEKLRHGCSSWELQPELCLPLSANPAAVSPVRSIVRPDVKRRGGDWRGYLARGAGARAAAPPLRGPRVPLSRELDAALNGHSRRRRHHPGIPQHPGGAVLRVDSDPVVAHGHTSTGVLPGAVGDEREPGAGSADGVQQRPLQGRFEVPVKPQIGHSIGLQAPVSIRAGPRARENLAEHATRWSTRY